MGTTATGLHVETFGDPADPTILLLAGASGSSDWWDERLCRLVADGERHVVRYDHRDTGQSPTDPPGAPSYGSRRLTDDVLEVADAVGSGRVHLVGMSMGGGIAQDVALRHPERVASLVLISTSAVGGVDAHLPGPTDALQAALADPPPDPDWRDDDAVVAWWTAAEVLMAGGAEVDRPWVEATARRMVERAHDVAASQNHHLVIAGGGPGDDEVDEMHLDVRRITAPTLVLHGDLDPLFPLAHGEALAAAVPGARLVVLEGVGHQAPAPRTWPRLTAEVLAHTAR